MRPKIKTRTASRTRTVETEQQLPRDLRVRLEQARLSLRALFRALDQLGIAQHLPPSLQALMSLDADFAESLWVLDQPARTYDVQAIADDTLGALSELPAARQSLMSTLSASERGRLTERVDLVARSLSRRDAYLHVPGRDPHG